MNAAWTKPYFGVTHLGDKAPRVTVTERGTFADLSCWYHGCGFSPLKSMHDSADAAKAAGEQWLASQRVAA